MVVDDEAPSAAALAELLRDEGHDVITADRGYRALYRASMSRIDMVIANLMLADMSGAQLYSELKACGRAPGFFVLMSAAADSFEEASAGLGHPLLSKPVSLQRLRAVVAERTEAIGHDRRRLRNDGTR